MNVLVLEPDEGIGRTIEEISEEGIVFFTVCTQRRAKARLREMRFDVICVNLAFNSMRGVALIKSLRSVAARCCSEPQEHLIAYASFTDLPLVQKSFARGADEYLGEYPLSPLFLARLRAIQRRSYPQQQFSERMEKAC